MFVDSLTKPINIEILESISMLWKMLDIMAKEPYFNVMGKFIKNFIYYGCTTYTCTYIYIQHFVFLRIRY